MCICDDKYFKVTNKTTGEERLYKHAASIAKRFDRSRSLIFDYCREGGRLSLKGDYYEISVNRHPECEILREKIIKYFKIRPSYIRPERLKLYEEKINEIEGV